MAIDHEAIAAALFRVVSQAADFTTINRRLRHWADVAPGEQPALFMSDIGGEARTVQGASNLPEVWIRNFQFFIYTYSSDPYLAPSIQLNQLITAVGRVLEPERFPDGSLGFNTLGLSPMVHWARVLGRVETDEGVLNEQALAIVPVQVQAA